MSVIPRPADEGPSSPAGGIWQDLTPEVGGVRFPNNAPIDGRTPYKCVCVCLNSFLSHDLQVGRATPGDQGASSLAGGKWRALTPEFGYVRCSNAGRIDDIRITH